MTAYRFSGVWLDISASTTMRYVTTNDDSGITIADALLNHSNAELLQYWHGELFTLTTPSPTNAQYPLVASIARLTFTTGLGNVEIVLPAPQAAILNADGITVDPSMITDVISAVVGHVVDAAGNPVTGFVSGTVTQGTVSPQ